jgi:uncharacterized protein involved in outer membrane biogenesis
MKFLQQPIEKKLSSLLGAKVTFQRLKISPLAGKMEAEGMTVAGDSPNQPLLTVARIEAQIAVTRALAGQLVIKSLVVEKPEILLDRRLAERLKKRPRTTAKPPTQTDEDTVAWQFEAQSIRIEGGQVRFQEDEYAASAGQIRGKLSCQNGKTQIKASIGQIGRQDEPVEFGPVEISGQVDAADPMAFATAPVHLTLKLADGLRVSLESANPSLRRAVIELQGKIDVNRYQSALPPTLAFPPAFSAVKFNGPIEMHTRLDISISLGAIFSRPKA